jgi:hypothetical protein
MGTNKVHFMIHAAEIMKWGGIIDCSAEPVEEGHKTWAKGQGRNTNQGASAAETIMNISPQKIASMELTQAIKGHKIVLSYCLHTQNRTTQIYTKNKNTLSLEFGFPQIASKTGSTLTARIGER